MIPTVGTLSATHSGGRLGVVLGARPAGPAADGQQVVALRLKAVDGRDSNGFAIPPGTGKTSSIAAAPATAMAPVNGIDPAVQNARPLAAKLQAALTPAEKQDVARLQQRDAQVRQEEQAHSSAAGDLAGPISYVYQIGPDGRQYAVGGSVPISAAAVTGDPAELRRIGARLEVAAQAAVNPSAQDLSAARTGLRLYAQANSNGANAIGAARPGTDITA